MSFSDFVQYVVLAVIAVLTVVICCKVHSATRQIRNIRQTIHALAATPRAVAQQQPLTINVTVNGNAQASAVPAQMPTFPTTFPTRRLAAYTDTVEVEENGDMITIGNKYIGREFQLSNGQLRTTRVINRRTDGAETVFVPQDGSYEFQVRLFDQRENEDLDLKTIDRTNWAIKADSYALDGPVNGRPECLIDGDDSTYWHTNYGGGGEGPQQYPHWALIDMGSEQTFCCFSYTPRQDNDNGNIANFELYASSTESDIDSKCIYKGEFAYDNGLRTMYFNLPQNCTARYVKLVGLNAHNGQNFAGGAEFRLHTEQAPNFNDMLFDSSNFTFTKTVESIGNNEGKKITFASQQDYTFNNINWRVRIVFQMKNGDHFMRKHIELGCPANQAQDARIDYIDVEHFMTAGTEVSWTHPDDSGVGGLVDFLAGAGQPVYLQGMFFGSEFPVCVNIITNKGLAHVRQFSGKSFQELSKENRFNNNYFRTWPGVAGAARSTDEQVVTNDFHAYLKTIQTATNMRAQYNSWYDWMLDIDENNIIKSFYEMERGLTQAGCSTLQAYVVDDGWNAYGPWQNENTAGFWQFNSKFPTGLTQPKALVERLGSTFGLWLGPRGGYAYQNTFAKFVEENGNGEYNPKSDDLCTNHKVYQQKLLEFFLDCQRKYDITYWKLDGFAYQPCPRKHQYHITGGRYGVHWMVEHWERYCGMFVKMRQDAAEHGINDLWINLTTFVMPSPWFLQFGNSIWLQNSADLGRVNTGLERQVDQCLTYRDGRVYDFCRVHQHRVPQCNVYNHDPIYGKTGSDLAGTMDDDEFRTYLFMIMTRGAALINLYFSYTMADEGQKWLVTADCLEWRKREYHCLRHSIQFGPGNPEKGFIYGYSCWDDETQEGIISLRNPKPAAQSYSFVLDRKLGVPEGVKNLQRTNVLNFRSSQAYENTKKWSYGDTISVNMVAGEAIIWKFSPKEDTVKPEVEFVKAGADYVDVTFTKRVAAKTAQFSINNKTVAATNVELRADLRTVRLSGQSFTKDQSCTLNVTIDDDNGRNRNTIKYEFIAYKDLQIAAVNSASDVTNSPSTQQDSTYQCQMLQINQQCNITNGLQFSGTHDFNLRFVLNAKSGAAGTVFAQGTQITASLQADGRLLFKVGGYSVTSEHAVADGKSHLISCCRERNAQLKIYVDGQLDASVASQLVSADKITGGQLSLGGAGLVAGIGAVQLRNSALNFNENADLDASLRRSNAPRPVRARHFTTDPDDNPLFAM